MKKITGFLGVAMIAAAMFFSTNAVSSSNSDTSLASLMSMNVAHADQEGGSAPKCSDYCEDWLFKTCSFDAKDTNGNNLTVTCHDMHDKPNL